MAEEKVGIENLKVALLHLVAISAQIAKLAKDGLDVSDAVVLASDPDLKALLSELSSFKQVLAEAKDVDLSEGLQLAVVLVPKILEVVKA